MDFKDDQESDIKNDEFVRFDNFDDMNFDEENLGNVPLKTKQSLGNSRNVHFHVDSFETD